MDHNKIKRLDIGAKKKKKTHNIEFVCIAIGSTSIEADKLESSLDISKKKFNEHIYSP